MNAQRLLQHFDRIAEAPDDVAPLRELILDLPVSAKSEEESHAKAQRREGDSSLRLCAFA
jgi:hypothetical protein